ncbi:coenzyme F420-0:L-glutamate ligase [Guptibacillus spartinae]|uniref:coenzyme F420-0:L-glutamate ligase n=1 Tax=Guptibacillus spartinae TaxID=3025679 RepID=UPI00235F3269|nr:coenzyme F420-0:L-glutamate ligase [Pseudalkalibacillus spartinae]
MKMDAIPTLPWIKKGDHIGEIIANAVTRTEVSLEDGDILCVASKVISTAEGREVLLSNVTAGEVAKRIHTKVPRKDARVIQKMIDVTEDPSGHQLEVFHDYIGAWLPNGMRLTSGGIDKIDAETIMLLPEDADKSAREIGETIQRMCNVTVGVVITDSDGRIEKKGATQIAIGLYGVPALRSSETIDSLTGEVKQSVETFCDLLAGAAALIMGQRGTNRPVVKISGVSYTFNAESTIQDSLSRAPN